VPLISSKDNQHTGRDRASEGFGSQIRKLLRNIDGIRFDRSFTYDVIEFTVVGPTETYQALKGDLSSNK